MKKVSLSHLPRYSPWPARLLGLSPFSRGKRTVKDILREYDTDKYGACMLYIKRHPKSSLEDVRWFERGGKHQRERCISMNEQLYASDAVSAYAKREKIFFELLKDPMRRCDTVIELGSGYGYNLAVLQKKYPSHQYLGGELSKNAIDVGNRLLLKRSIVIHPFNFYDPVYSVFRNTKSRRILVLTNHATEMLPDASLFLKRLAPFRNRIASVVQLEPVYEMAESSDLLGLLRRKYTQMNNYNMNLLAALCARPDIVIKRKRYDFFGINPLFPESLIEWQFK